MNKVTLYQTTKSEHLTYSGHVTASQMTYDDVTRIRGSDKFISKREIKNLEYPVQEYVFLQQDWKGNVEKRIVCAAFDDELLELIQCERSKFQNLNDDLVCKVAEIADYKHREKYLENECLQLKTKLSKIVQMNWWKRIVFIFKGWKHDNGTQ